MTTPRGVCVKVASLRPRYDNLEEFLQNPKNVLVCRRGRVFITSRDGDRKVFAYAASPFANPFKVGTKAGSYSLAESLRLYRDHLDNLLLDENVKAAFLQLADAEQIGCFCDTNSNCHRDIIIEKLRSFSEELQRIKES